MKVFLSWAGERSKAVASALRQWLPDVIQDAEPWLSASDIDAGARWSRRIQDELAASAFGVICLTRTNQLSPWILFEAGALAKTIEDAFVCPYLVDLAPSDLESGPLTQFQAKRATESDTLELVRSMNKAQGAAALGDDKVERAFRRWWPDLNAALENLPVMGPQPPRKPAQDLLEELLVSNREIYRMLRERQEQLPVQKEFSVWQGQQRADNWLADALVRDKASPGIEALLKHWITSADPAKLRKWAQFIEGTISEEQKEAPEPDEEIPLSGEA